MKRRIKTGAVVSTHVTLHINLPVETVKKIDSRVDKELKARPGLNITRNDLVRVAILAWLAETK